MADVPIRNPDIYIGGKLKPKSKPKVTDELRKREERFSGNRVDRRVQRRSSKS